MIDPNVYNHTCLMATEQNSETPSRCFVSEGVVIIINGTIDTVYKIPV